MPRLQAIFVASAGPHGSASASPNRRKRRPRQPSTPHQACSCWWWLLSPSELLTKRRIRDLALDSILRARPKVGSPGSRNVETPSGRPPADHDRRGPQGSLSSPLCPETTV